MHARYLNELTTRHYLPISQFIGGFFKATPKTNQYLSALTIYSEYNLENTLRVLHPTQHSSNELVAHHLHKLLDTLKSNEKWLTYMTNRLVTTQLNDIREPLEMMLHSPLFEKLNASHPKTTSGTVILF